MKHKFLSLLAAIAVAASLTACQSGETGQYLELVDEVVSETEQTIETVEMKTIEPPEDGWTANNLLDVTYVYNQKITLPCTIDTLGSSLSYDKNYEYLTDEESNTISITLFQNKDSVASAVLNDCQNIQDVDSNTVVERLFFADFLSVKNKDNIFINGITFNDDKSAVIEKLGVPNIDEKNYIEYYDKESGNILLKINFDDNSILSILLILE